MFYSLLWTVLDILMILLLCLICPRFVDLRADITAFGHMPGTVDPPMHTPNIDALGAKSLVFIKNYVQQAVSLVLCIQQ